MNVRWCHLIELTHAEADRVRRDFAAGGFCDIADLLRAREEADRLAAEQMAYEGCPHPAPEDRR